MSNIVCLCGRLGKDPELTQAGDVQVCNLSIATTDSYKDKHGQWIKNTDWHSAVCFSGQAKYVSDNAKKGDMIHVIGMLKTRSWDKDGKKHYKTEVLIKSVDLFLQKPKNKQATDSESSEAEEW